MEANSGGTLIYTSNPFSYKPRNNLTIYEPSELEFTFIDTILMLILDASINIQIWTLILFKMGPFGLFTDGFQKGLPP